jgi:branched-chain amino acid transport system ATP-binding protein
VSNEPLLEVRGITVRYGEMTALHDISYRVFPGQAVCLLGGNASGKSTSMKAIFGTVPLAAGEIWWEGKRLDRVPTYRRVGAGLAAVPEGRRVFATMSVAENLRTGATGRRDTAGIRSDLDEVYDMFPRLQERSAQAAGTLSGGEQQMVAIGRALMSRPKLLCMDEPSMGLAPKLVRQSFQMIERISARGTAVFVVEQNARAALAIADYAYVLASGAMTLEGPSATVLSDPLMVDAYLGQAAETAADARN